MPRMLCGMPMGPNARCALLYAHSGAHVSDRVVSAFSGEMPRRADDDDLSLVCTRAVFHETVRTLGARLKIVDCKRHCRELSAMLAQHAAQGLYPSEEIYAVVIPHVPPRWQATFKSHLRRALRRSFDDRN